MSDGVAVGRPIGLTWQGRASPLESVETRSDCDIALDLLESLWYGSGELCATDLQFLEVRSRDGVVELMGRTPSAQTRAMIEATALRVRGVVGMRNHLDTVEALDAVMQRARSQAHATGGRRDPHRPS